MSGRGRYPAQLDTGTRPGHTPSGRVGLETGVPHKVLGGLWLGDDDFSGRRARTQRVRGRELNGVGVRSVEDMRRVLAVESVTLSSSKSHAHVTGVLPVEVLLKVTLRGASPDDGLTKPWARWGQARAR